MGGSAGTGGAPSAGQGGGGSGGAPSGGSGSSGAPSGGQGGGGAGGTTPGGGTGGTPSGNGGSGGSDPGELDAGSPDAGDPDAGASDAGASDAGDAGDAGGDAGACYDSADDLVSCAELGHLECSGQEAFLSSECEILQLLFKPATMNAARSCMIALDPPELCDPANTYACLGAALAGSCPDSEADDECTVIGAACDDSLPAIEACSSTLSGMTQDGRNQMVQCMTTQTCDLEACIEGLN